MSTGKITENSNKLKLTQCFFFLTSKENITPFNLDGEAIEGWLKGFEPWVKLEGKKDDTRAVPTPYQAAG